MWRGLEQPCNVGTTSLTASQGWLLTALVAKTGRMVVERRKNAKPYLNNMKTME